jgi:hypothetical protein
MCYWKWRLCRTKVRNLLDGRPQTPSDSDGDQQQKLLASVTNSGDAGGNDECRLIAQDLISVRALWMKAHGYA